MTTIGAGANAYIIGTATGTALGASSPVIALSIATGVLKAVFVMVVTPFVARAVGPRQSPLGDDLRRRHGLGQRGSPPGSPPPMSGSCPMAP